MPATASPRSGDPMAGRGQAWRGYLLAALVLAAVCVPRAVSLLRCQALLAFYERESTRLASENERLREDIARMRTDPLAVERAARDTFGEMAPGESRFIIRKEDVSRKADPRQP